MIVPKVLVAAAAALSLIALPAFAQTGADTERNGHHYQGGPKTVVPHHMGKKETVGVSTGSSGGAPLPGRARDIDTAPYGRQAAVAPDLRWGGGTDGTSNQMGQS